MKKRLAICGWLSWLIAAGAQPAHANNPPAADGMLFLILVFPFAILANRLAGVTLPAQSKVKRILLLLILALATFFAVAGTMIGFLAMVVILIYGLARGARAIQLGRGAKRFALGIVVILFSFFAAANYLASISSRTLFHMSEDRGVKDLRNIVVAQNQFRSAARLDADKNQIPEFGSLSQLHEAGLLQGSALRSDNKSAYAYAVLLTGKPPEDEKRFFAYAKPRNFAGSANLGISLIDSIRTRPRPARLTFATDESGIIRAADLNASRDVTREEAQSWPVRSIN